MTVDQKIAAAAKRCRAAFKAHPAATWAWCCHHEVFAEQLSEPAENRICYILSDKAKSQQEQRLNNFRPVRDEKEFAPLWKTYEDGCAALWKTYDDGRAALWKTCEDGRAALRKTCEDGRAALWKTCEDGRAALWKTYDDGRAPLRKTCDDGRAALWKTCEDGRAALWKPLKTLYQQDVPRGTWKGNSIFSK